MSDSQQSIMPSSNVPWGFDYYRVKSNSSVNYDSFNGDIEFKMNSSESEKWMSGKNCYTSIRLRVCQTDETGVVGRLAPIVNTGVSKAGATLVSIPYIAPNPGACLFSSVSCDIGGQTISLNQNIAQVNTIYRMLYESESEQKTVNSTNPIKLMSLQDADITANKACVLTNHFTGYPNTLTNFEF